MFRMAASAPRRLAWLALAALGLVMMLGNVVSATGSGLGCPDWPLCHGRFIPPGGTEIWIEFRHRLGVPLFSALLVATAVVTLRRAESRLLRRVAVALLALLAVQIVLGGITVKLGLPAPVSTVHLLTALTIMAGLLTIAAGGITDPLGSPSAAPRQATALARLARVGLPVLLGQLALGGYVRHSGAGLACPDFPLCSGDVLPGAGLPLIHWVHRWLGVLLLGLFLHVAMASRRTPLASVGAALGAVAVLQVALGVAAVLMRLPVPVRAAHAAGGYALWGLLVWLALRSGVWRAGAGARADRESAAARAPVRSR
jgi:heme A synthase